MIPYEGTQFPSSRYDGRESLPLPPSNAPPLSLAEARGVLFWSFYISQGNTVLHEEVLRYVAQHRQGWRLSQQQQAVLYHLIEVSIHKLIACENHMPVKSDVIKSDLKAQIGLFRAMLNRSRRQAANANEVNLRHIIRRLIKEGGRFLGCSSSAYHPVERRDRRFRCGDRLPRGNRSTPPLLDPFFSFVCFALLGRPLCEVQVVNDLLADVRKAFLERGNTWRKAMVGHEALFSQVVSVWNRKPPFQQIDPTAYLPR